MVKMSTSSILLTSGYLEIAFPWQFSRKKFQSVLKGFVYRLVEHLKMLDRIEEI